MTREDFRNSLNQTEPPAVLSTPLAALWWDARGEWAKAHGLVDELETKEAMAVHAYLHRKEGAESNANYWYKRSGRTWHRPALEEEWQALVEGLLAR